MSIQVRTETIIRINNREFIHVPLVDSWRESNNAFALRRDAGHFEQVLIEVLDSIYVQHQEDTR